MAGSDCLARGAGRPRSRNPPPGRDVSDADPGAGYLGVYERCKKHPAERGALRRDLRDRQSARRALAALVLGRQGGAAEQAAVRNLLADPKPLVRLRAAQGLLAAHDTTAIPTLIELLRTSPHPLDWEATELLHWAAGCNSGVCTNAMGRPAPPGVAPYERWRRWWASARQGFQWPSAPEPVQCPRLFLVTESTSILPPLRGRVMLCGGNGLPYWEFATGSPPGADLLPGGQLLVAADGQLTRRDTTGKVLWAFHLAPKHYWRTADHRYEPDGTTTVAGDEEIFSLDERGRVIDGSARGVPLSPWVDDTTRSRHDKLVGRRLYLGLGTADPKQLSLWDCDLAGQERPRKRL